MASEIRVNQIQNRSGLGTVTFSDTGVSIVGIVTATSFMGDGSQLIGISASGGVSIDLLEVMLFS